MKHYTRKNGILKEVNSDEDARTATRDGVDLDETGHVSGQWKRGLCEKPCDDSLRHLGMCACQNIHHQKFCQ